MNTLIDKRVSFKKDHDEERKHPMERSQSQPSREAVVKSLQGVASWMEHASASTHTEGLTHRIAVYYEGEKMNWLYPHSNTGEAISAWMDLADILERPDYVERARVYAARMVGDPVKGLYRGEVREAHGLPWYWTDGGSYAGIYGFRMPFHFRRIYEKTGDPEFLEVCFTMGETVLRRLLPSGLVDAGWSPQNGWKEGGNRIGCRVMYAMAMFATLHQITGDQRYQNAYEASVGALQQMQNKDGSFFQHYVVETGAPHPTEKSIKPFFYGYILNAIAEAYAVYSDQRILEVARGIGQCLVEIYRYRNAIPYCTGADMLPADKVESETAIYSVSNGLLWLHSVTGEREFLALGSKIWADAAYAQSTDLNPDWHGAIIQGANPELARALEGVPANRTHLRYDPQRVGKCTLWEMVNHVFAGRRLSESLWTESLG